MSSVSGTRTKTNFFCIILHICILKFDFLKNNTSWDVFMLPHPFQRLLHSTKGLWSTH